MSAHRPPSFEQKDLRGRQFQAARAFTLDVFRNNHVLMASRNNIELLVLQYRLPAKGPKTSQYGCFLASFAFFVDLGADGIKLAKDKPSYQKQFVHLWFPVVLLGAVLFHYYKPFQLRRKTQKAPPCCVSDSDIPRTLITGSAVMTPHYVPLEDSVPLNEGGPELEASQGL
ncbi:hypothetical protein Efla_003985 [Eimeria flavescens]